MNHESRHDSSSCPVCKGETNRGFRGESFCPPHKSALENIRKHYKEWARAYSSLAKGEYLQLLIRNPNSGEWVVEVARYLLELNETERL